MKVPQFWVIAGLLAGTATLVHVRGDQDRVPPSEPLSRMPQQLGPWSGIEEPLNQETIDVLGKGVFLNRLYESAAPRQLGGNPEQGALRLFIGYFPTQRTGQAIHSPQHCLPGSGWVFDSSGVTDIPEGNGKTMQVGEYVISNGPVKAEVLYWYRSHGRNIANDYTAKLYMLLDSIRLARTDAALIRIVTPIDAAGPQAAHDRAIAFATRLSPLLPSFIPD